MLQLAADLQMLHQSGATAAPFSTRYGPVDADDVIPVDTPLQDLSGASVSASPCHYHAANLRVWPSSNPSNPIVGSSSLI